VREAGGRGWPGVELRHLLTLEAVAEEASFRRAARRLGYSQSAVSQQVAALERAIGHRVVDRGVGERVALTAVGAVVMEHARAIDDHLRAAHADVARLSLEGARLRVGTFPGVGGAVLAHVMAQFEHAAPGVALLVEEHPRVADPLEALRLGDLDLAFAVLPLPPGPFVRAKLFDESFALVVRADSALARARRAPTTDDLGTLPLITSKDCPATACALESVRAAGVEPAVVFRSSDVATVQQLVAAGFGAGLIPTTSTPSGDLVRLDLDGLLPHRITVLVWHEHRASDPSLEAFVETARRVGRRLSVPLRASAA